MSDKERGQRDIMVRGTPAGSVMWHLDSFSKRFCDPEASQVPAGLLRLRWGMWQAIHRCFKPVSTKAPGPRTLSGFCPWMAKGLASYQQHSPALPACPLPLLRRNPVDRTQNSAQAIELLFRVLAFPPTPGSRTGLSPPSLWIPLDAFCPQ
jgi:hypothetical protein